MSTAENKAIARRWFEDGFNGHNLDVFGELAAEEFRPAHSGHSPWDDGRPRGQ